MARPRIIGPKIGQRLVFLEKKFGDRKKFIEFLGVNESTYGNYVREDSDPTGTFLVRIREATDVDINWLLTGVGEPFCRADSSEGPSGYAVIEVAGTLAKTIAERDKRVAVDPETFGSVFAELLTHFVEEGSNKELPDNIVDFALKRAALR